MNHKVFECRIIGGEFVLRDNFEYLIEVFVIDRPVHFVELNQAIFYCLFGVLVQKNNIMNSSFISPISFNYIGEVQNGLSLCLIAIRVGYDLHQTQWKLRIIFTLAQVYICFLDCLLIVIWVQYNFVGRYNILKVQILMGWIRLISFLHYKQ